MLRSSAELFEHRIACRIERRAAELLDAEPAPRFVLVDPGDRVVRAHLRAMAAQRGELARHPVADVDDEVGGLAASPNASGSMPQKLESAGEPPLAWAASTTSRITPCGIVT